MIEEKDILNIGYYHCGQAFTGSYRGMRYRIAREPLEDVRFKKNEEKFNAKLKLSVWDEPYAYDHTDKEAIKDEYFEYSSGGLKEIVAYLRKL